MYNLSSIFGDFKKKYLVFMKCILFTYQHIFNQQETNINAIMSQHVKDIQTNPVKSTIILAIPIIVLLFLNALYGVIDIFWIGGIGESAVICMGYIANFAYTLHKVGDGIGRSVNALISNAFGAEDIEKTEKYAEQGLILILAISVIIPIISIPLIGPICVMADLVEYSDLIYAYLAPFLGFIILIMMNNFFSAVLGSEGDTKRATIIITAGNLLNIILDPILIFDMKMGMLGAGIATIVGCGLSMILFFYLYLIKKDTLVKIHIKGLKIDADIMKEIIFLAIPIIIDGIILSLLGIIVTFCLHIYASETVVFAYIIMLNIQTTVFTPVQGISKGLGIVTGHLAGAKRFTVLRKTIIKILTLGLCLAAAIAILIVVFHNPIISIFSNQYLVMREVRNILMFVVICIMTFPIVMGCSYIFLGLEKSIYTLIFIVFNLITLVVFIGIFTHILKMGSFGIFLAIALSNLIEAGSMLVVLKRMINTRIITFEHDDGVETAV